MSVGGPVSSRKEKDNHSPRSNSIHANSLACPLITERLGQHVHSPFTRRIRHHVDSTLERRQTSRIDNTALDPFVNPILPGILTQLKRGLQIRLQHFVVGFVGECGRGQPPLDPRHVDQNLECVVRANPLNQPLYLGAYAQVGGVDAAFAT